VIRLCQNTIQPMSKDPLCLFKLDVTLTCPMHNLQNFLKLTHNM